MLECWSTRSIATRASTNKLSTSVQALYHGGARRCGPHVRNDVPDGDGRDAAHVRLLLRVRDRSFSASAADRAFAAVWIAMSTLVVALFFLYAVERGTGAAVHSIPRSRGGGVRGHPLLSVSHQGEVRRSGYSAVRPACSCSCSCS
ncbi:unnamed protein product [Urochloa humidicola]